MKPFIGIKNIWYGEVWNENTISIAKLNTWLASASQVQNVHQGTWGYTQDDPDITDYVNELTGTPYYRDVNSNGAKTIAFTLGVYAFKNRVDLQGGKMLTADGAQTADEAQATMWEAPENYEVIYKAILAQTKTGNFVFFPRAGIVAKTDTQEKNLGLGVTAVAMDEGKGGVSEEYWIDGDKATTLAAEQMPIG